jgi:hypothetical protein
MPLYYDIRLSQAKLCDRKKPCNGLDPYDKDETLPNGPSDSRCLAYKLHFKLQNGFQYQLPQVCSISECDFT